MHLAYESWSPSPTLERRRPLFPSYQIVEVGLALLGAARVRELEGITESVTFPLPKSIAKAQP